MKIPRYSTEGACRVLKPKGNENAVFLSGVTSAHHSQGDTPSRRDSSMMPYAVPCRSLPATNSLPSGNTVSRKACVLPSKTETSAPVVAINGLLPIVPTIISPCLAFTSNDVERTASTSRENSSRAVCTTLSSTPSQATLTGLPEVRLNCAQPNGAIKNKSKLKIPFFMVSYL